jgi:Mg/Co/Ni transporter MgtE
MILDGSQTNFPVVEEGRVAGVLSREDLMEGARTHGVDAPVRAVLTPGVATVAPEELVESAMERIMASPCAAVPVVDQNRLVGMLTPENVSEFVHIHRAIPGSSWALGERRCGWAPGGGRSAEAAWTRVG